jgi:hypothetical protein
MKKLIRRGVFETNSSSSHSVSIGMDQDKEFVLDTIYPNQNGTITIHGDEFGWEWFKHNDAITKASYAAQQFRYDENSLETLKEVIIEQTGAEQVEFVGLDDGYVDHDSQGILTSSKHWLKDFIFNKNSWLFGGNDNSYPDPTFYDVPEIKDGKIIEPTYKYELVIDGLNTTTKFRKNPTNEELSNAIDSLLGSMIYVGGEFVEDNFMWAISRNGKLVYKLGWNIDQDYKKNQIILTQEDDGNLWFQIRKRLEESFELDGLTYDEKNKRITEEFVKVPDSIKIINFILNEI